MYGKLARIKFSRYIEFMEKNLIKSRGISPKSGLLDTLS